MSFKLNKYLVTWQETEHYHDYHDRESYPVTVDKYAMVSDVNALQNYITKKCVKFYELGNELNVKLNTTVEVKVTFTVRG